MNFLLHEGNNFSYHRSSARNSQDDFLVLHNIGVPGNYQRSPFITEVLWNLLPPGWLKVNIDGFAKGAPGFSGCGSIFRNNRGLTKGCFVTHLRLSFAFEAEIICFILAIETTHKHNWLNLWVETNSTFCCLAF